MRNGPRLFPRDLLYYYEYNASTHTYTFLTLNSPTLTKARALTACCLFTSLLMPAASDERLRLPGRPQRVFASLLPHAHRALGCPPHPQGVQLNAAMATGYRYVCCCVECQSEASCSFDCDTAEEQSAPLATDGCLSFPV